MTYYELVIDNEEKYKKENLIKWCTKKYFTTIITLIKEFSTISEVRSYDIIEQLTKMSKKFKDIKITLYYTPDWDNETTCVYFYNGVTQQAEEQKTFTPCILWNMPVKQVISKFVLGEDTTRRANIHSSYFEIQLKGYLENAEDSIGDQICIFKINDEYWLEVYESIDFEDNNIIGFIHRYFQNPKDVASHIEYVRNNY